MGNILQDRILDALRNQNASYVEIRLDTRDSTNVRYRGRQLEEVSRTSDGGGCVRALAGGGWGFVSFNSLNNLREQVNTAIRNARLVGGDPVILAPSEPIVDKIYPRVKKDPSKIALKDKKALLDQYVDELSLIHI